MSGLRCETQAWEYLLAIYEREWGDRFFSGTVISGLPATDTEAFLWLLSYAPPKRTLQKVAFLMSSFIISAM